MKIYGSLFLWIPLSIFLIWLGIKELPENILQIIYKVLFYIFIAWNSTVILLFIIEKDVRDNVKELIKTSFLETLITIFIIPILVIPVLTYYLNDKLTVKI